MAIDLLATYPANTDPVSPDYPFGTPRNETAPGALDGTPLEQAMYRDIFGFLAAMLEGATPPIVPTNASDTAQVSQYLDALKSILLQRSELIGNGGDIVTVGQALKRGGLYGLRTTRDSGVLMTTLPGGARNAANTADIELAASLQKDIGAAWIPGAGGGRPASVPLSAGQWYRRFVVMKPDGSGVDVTWDTDPGALNFFNNEGAANGYSDATLYRRYGWTLTDAGSAIRDYYSNEDDPTIYTWVATEFYSLNFGPNAGPRQSTQIPDVPPNALGRFVIGAQNNGGPESVLITSAEQSDQGAGGFATPGTAATFITSAVAAAYAATNVYVKVDGARNIFARVSGTPGEVQDLDANVIGWQDFGVTA